MSQRLTKPENRICEDCSSVFTTSWAQRLCNPCRTMRAKGYPCTECGRKTGHSGRRTCWQCFSGPTPLLRAMSLPELGWLVGVMEGEGYFGTVQRYGTVRVVMTDEDVVNKLQTVTGVGVVGGLSCRAQHHRKPYAWSVLREPNVLALMQVITPFLSKRRRLSASAVLALHGQGVPAEQPLRPGSPEAWGWVAGLIEGEGWICPSPLAKRKRILLAASSTDLDVIERLTCLTGVGTIYAIPPKRQGCKPAQMWSVNKKGRCPDGPGADHASPWRSPNGAYPVRA